MPFVATKILILCRYSQIQQALCLKLFRYEKFCFSCSGDYRRCPDYQYYVQDVGTLKQQWGFVKIGKMNIYGNKNGAAEKPKTFGQHRLFRCIAL